MLAARLASRGRCLAARQARTLATGSYRIAGGNVPAQDPNVDMNLGRTPERTAELERLAEEHNGFLFGELPPKEGESRQWEDWEYIYYPLMTSAFLIYATAFVYRYAATAAAASLRVTMPLSFCVHDACHTQSLLERPDLIQLLSQSSPLPLPRALIDVPSPPPILRLLSPKRSMASEARMELERRIEAGEVEDDGAEFKLHTPLLVYTQGADSRPGR